jgi:RNA polymerase sigma factor (sigma-70 family)
MTSDDSLSRTSTELLQRWANLGDHAAWSTFDTRYRPVLQSFFSRMGVESGEVSDLTQETLLEFLKLWKGGGYQRERGHVRSLLLSIASHRCVDNRRKRRNQQASLSSLDAHPAKDELDQVWESAWQRHVIAQALERLHTQTDLSASTIQAFVETALEERSVEEVAAKLAISKSSIYVAKHRCLEHLRRILAQLAVEYEDPQLAGLLLP